MTTSARASMVETPEERNIHSLWTLLRVNEKQIEKRGLQFGQAMYEYREKYGRPLIAGLLDTKKPADACLLSLRRLNPRQTWLLRLPRELFRNETETP